MGVQINETGADNFARAIVAGSCIHSAQVTDCSDVCACDADVSAEAVAAGAIHNYAITQNKIKTQRLPFFP